MNKSEWLLFLGLGAVWGSSFMWIKIAVQDIGPFALVGWRLLFGSLGLAVVLRLKGTSLPRRRSTWRDLVLLGLVNTALPFVLISWGEQTVDSSVASILNSTVPLFTLVIAHFFLAEESMEVRRVVGLLVGFGGVLLLMSRDLIGGVQASLIGQFAVLAAAVSYASAAVFARRRLRTVHSFVQAFVPMAAADAVVWSLAWPFERGDVVPAAGLTWFALVWLGLLGSCLAYILYFSLLERVGPTRTTLVTYLIALFGVILGVVFLNEPLDIRLAGGGALVIAGIAVVNWRPGRAERPGVL